MAHYTKTTHPMQCSTSLTFHEVLVLVAHKTGCNPRQSGKGYVALCPAHKDTCASLSITQGDDGKILLHCHTGCTFKEICASLGIAAKNLFPRNKGDKSHG